jgi:hypothetical protein
VIVIAIVRSDHRDVEHDLIVMIDGVGCIVREGVGWGSDPGTELGEIFFKTEPANPLGGSLIVTRATSWCCEAVWEPERYLNAICPPGSLRVETTDTVRSAFEVAGFDFSIPPVVRAISKPVELRASSTR